MKTEKQKVYLENSHVGYVNKELLLLFRSACKVSNYSAWMKQQAELCFGVRVRSAADLPALDAAVKENFYDNIAEWLQELMRNGLRELGRLPYLHE